MTLMYTAKYCRAEKIMLLRHFLIFLGAVNLAVSQNSTDDLEVRVTLLENDVSNLQDDVEEVETDNNLQDERLNTMELILNENSNDTDDLDTSVDETQNAMLIMQQRMAVLEGTNSLLLQRLNYVETVLNATTESVQDLDVDIQDTNIRLTTVEEDVAVHQVQIEAVEQSDTEQNDRMSVLEDDVDTWNDRIVALEATDRDIQGRLVTLEETILTPWVACDSSPCDNGGSCIDVNVDTFVCMCRDGYFGETCQNSYTDISFLASFDYDPGTPPDPIVFNVAPLNPGSHYDVTSGIYTVPIDGIYEFMFHIWLFDHPAFNAYLEVDNVRIFRGYSAEATHSRPFLHITGLLSLTAGQEVWVSPVNLEEGMQGVEGTAYESWFAGHLIYAV